MHVADGHGPVLDIPGQLLHWQLPKRARHSVAAMQSIQSARRRAWTERPGLSTPSAPVLQRAGVERRQLYYCRRHHVADMARAAEPHECARCALKVFLRFVFIPLDPALLAARWTVFARRVISLKAVSAQRGTVLLSGVGA